MKGSSPRWGKRYLDMIPEITSILCDSYLGGKQFTFKEAHDLTGGKYDLSLHKQLISRDLIVRKETTRKVRTQSGFSKERISYTLGDLFGSWNFDKKIRDQ